MQLKSIILGIAVTTVLLGVLVATRLMVLAPQIAEFEIREVETVSLPEPPPPLPEEQLEEDVPPPPPPAIANLTDTPDLSQPALPDVKIQVNPHLAVDTFFTDQPPAPLPTVTRPTPRPVTRPTVKNPVRPTIKPSTPKPKSQYALGELDKKPRLLRNPSVSFPRSIRNATSGRVVVRVAILPSGKSQFLSVSSTTHPELIPLAKRIANGSRFTPPTRQGKPVKAVMSWPIIIKK